MSPSSSSKAVEPGKTIGILGGGQLGRMLALSARKMGYGVQVYTDSADSPACAVADKTYVADYRDEAQLKAFADQVDVVTLEFENIPVEALTYLQASVPVYPQPHVLETTQHRLKEKRFLQDLGIPVTPFAPVESLNDLNAAIAVTGLPAILKTAGFGYDGKGQARIHTLEDAQAAFQKLGQVPCILEKQADLAKEISVIAARNASGQFAAYRPVENRHVNHILDLTLAPAQLDSAIEAQALEIAERILTAFNLIGLLCVEFFITQDGCLLVNELAPRPHNSGHYTIEAAVCDQFEQQLRAVCNLPLGDTTLRSPGAAMANLLGDCWNNGEPNWKAALTMPATYLHLYGKKAPKPGRKMGHLTALAADPQAAAQQALEARRLLTAP